MPRRKHLRKIVEPPRFGSFRPTGVTQRKKESIELLYEEYEAIKLADFDHLHHHEACKLMGVSRPTFARIYQTAREKIARALVEVREIKAVYGNVEFDQDWYYCNSCHAKFTLQTNTMDKSCPICSGQSVVSVFNAHAKQ